MQLHVMNSPFDDEQVQLLNQLLPKLSEAQQLWLGGYITGLNMRNDGGANPQEATPKQVTKEITILYGSQTGNCQNLAEDYANTLKSKDYKVTLSSLNDFKTNRLKKLENVLIIVSTHGEGDPPDNAILFYEYLHSNRAPKLADLQFAVLSLGDSSYEFFCQTGIDAEKRLLELGAKPLVPRVDCDLDFDEPAAKWFQDVLKKLEEQQSAAGSTSEFSPLPIISEVTAYSRTKPFYAEVLENINLNGRGSNKETRHVVLSLEGSNLTFEPGDSIGIFPKNDSVLVEALISEMNWNAEESVTLNDQGDILSLREALTSNLEITVLTKPLLQKAAKYTPDARLLALLEPDHDAKLKEYIYGRDVLDLVRDFGPWEMTPNEFTCMLRKIPSRLYSIASSYQASPDEVHLTIGTVRYEAHGRERIGVCSGECALRLEIGDTIPVYIQKNSNFRLPTNNETPIIMIGPGTGIAPFRAFMEERAETGENGKSWLIFGDQHFRTDFLYQIEWQKYLKDGTLSKLDIAFSRDTDQKVYVQHKMIEKSNEFFQWLEEGAVVYVCGDEKNMAADVHAAILTIIESEGNMSSDEAVAYLANMQREKRYQRDVY